MKHLLILAALAIAPQAHASIGSDIIAGFKVTATSIRTNHMVAPWSDMVPGQYLDMVTGETKGAPSCPPGPMQKYGKPFC